jgi:hypothetical protein
MNIKIKYHVMPWEVDYALLSFTQLKESFTFLNPEDKIYMEVALNLSSYIINWKESKLPKQFFIDKFKSLLTILDDVEVNATIYDGDELWGHLDLERNQFESHIDYYISICPDIWFHKHLLYYMVEGAKQLKEKYFLITPETYKLWDWTWDELVNDKYKDVPYEDWDKLNPTEIQAHVNSLGEPFIQMARHFKYAGWFDLYSKAYVEELIPIPDEWKGYGPWDYYGMLVLDEVDKRGGVVEANEYILRNQIIYEQHPDKDNKNNLTSYYKDLIVLNKIEDQRQVVESKFPYYIEQWIKYAKSKNLIK